ncbi:MAG: restriction endonuclease, partial [bacterium]|nr:restriction endonuclease [bacterium]
VGWLLEISGKYLEAGRLSRWRMTPFLTAEEGLQAVYTYAEVNNEPITNETALLINQLCLSDPFFISCVMQSDYEHRDLTTEDGVINTVNYEISDRNSEMSETWREYLDITLQRVNDFHAKNLLLHLNKYPDRYWTHHELKDALSLDISPEAIKERLVILAESDMIDRGVSDIGFRGLQDGTLNLILRNRFEKEINNFIPDLKHEFQEQIKALKKENRRLQGTLNNLSGQFAEYQLLLSVRSKKRFALSAYFSGVQDTTRLNIVGVKQRVPLQREDGKQMELDVVAESSCGRIVVVEVKKWKDPVGITPVEDFVDKLAVYAKQVPDNTILPAFLSLGGFTEDALRLCEEQGIGTAERIAHF